MGWLAVVAYAALCVWLLMKTFGITVPEPNADIVILMDEVEYMAPSESAPAEARPLEEEPMMTTNDPEAPEVLTPAENTLVREDEAVRQVDQRALFPGSSDTAPAATQRPQEMEDEESDSQGYSLEGRYLVGHLPRPAYEVDAAGRVVIKITVNGDGVVTRAEYQQEGSTTNHAVLVAASRAAALKARFTEDEAAIQTGTITYIFRLN